MRGDKTRQEKGTQDNKTKQLTKRERKREQNTLTKPPTCIPNKQEDRRHLRQKTRRADGPWKPTPHLWPDRWIGTATWVRGSGDSLCNPLRLLNHSLTGGRTLSSVSLWCSGQSGVIQMATGRLAIMLRGQRVWQWVWLWVDLCLLC